jgi:hypothetical protein
MEKQELLCPIHIVKLSHLLKGNIGYCKLCCLYTAPLNHAPIALDEHIRLKREESQLKVETKKPPKRRSSTRRSGTKAQHKPAAKAALQEKNR